MIEGDEALIIGGDKAYLVPLNQNIEEDMFPRSPWALRPCFLPLINTCSPSLSSNPLKLVDLFFLLLQLSGTLCLLLFALSSHFNLSSLHSKLISSHPNFSLS